MTIEVATDDTRPTFQTPARPLEIPAALRQLPPLTEIRAWADFGGMSGKGTARAGQYVAYLGDIMRRQAEGLFTLAEAAQVLADSRPGADVRSMLQKMHKAYRDGKLNIRDPGDQLPKVIADFHRDYFDLVKVSDIDAWLTQDGAGYLFPPETYAPAIEKADPKRRLDALRALGGNVKLWKGNWQITGIGKLVAREKADKRKRADEKTIRADLKLAADEAKREGKGAIESATWHP